MIFARKVWTVLVAIKDGLVLLFLLLFFLALYAALISRPGPGVVRDGALLLRIDGAVVEEPAIVDPLERLLAQTAPVGEYRQRDLVRAIRLAAKDERIKAVVLDLSRFTGAGQVHLVEIGEALDQVRAAKKPVLAYATAYVDDGLLLAAHASEVWVDPLGGAFVIGPGGSRPYLRGLLDRFKVNVNIYKAGKFKGAVEPFERRDMSPESRESEQPVIQALFDEWKASVTRARPRANLAQVTGDPAAWLKAAGGDAALAAKNAGLVDRIGSDVEFGTRVAEIVGKDDAETRPGAFVHTPLRTWLAANPAPTPGKAIGVVTIAGEIVDGDAGPGTAGGQRIADMLDRGLDREYAALVVRVDSPGGSIFASERIRTAIERYRAKGIPVVVSMSNLAASGGYWVSTPAQRIFAEPATITGSIGVFAMLPTFDRALADWGVNFDGIRTTPLSGQPDLAGGFTPAVSQMIQANVESHYARFVGLVARSRGKTPEAIDGIAQGRIWDGGAARQLGLVDQFGGLDDALEYAATAAKLKAGEWHPEYMGESHDQFFSLLERLRGDDESAPPAEAADLAALVTQHERLALARAVVDAKRLLGTGGARAYCLECAPAAAPRAVEAEATAGLRDIIMRWWRRD